MSLELVRTLRAELAPSPERVRGATEITVLVMATVLADMAMRVPEAALSCYLVYFAWRDNAGAMIFEPLKLLAAVTLALPLMAWLLDLAIDNEMLRLALVLGFSFLGMFLSQASRLGPMAGTAGFIFAFGLTIPDVLASPGLLSHALTSLWAVIAVPMCLMLGWGLLGAVRPDHRLMALIDAREKAAVADPDGEIARTLLDQGMAEADELLAFSRRMGRLVDAPAEALARRADDSYLRLALAEAGAAPRASEGAEPPDKAPLLRADAFRNPRYTRFALKVMLAVAITYGFYTAFGLFEIHTAMITCFYVALGSRGETHHKIVLRLGGCLLGAAVGSVAVLAVVPHLTDIGQLLLLVGPVAFVAAWIALGSERISYAGWQMALCFFLVVLYGFAPPTGVGAALDRITGILVGIAVMWLVFTAIWPVSAADDAREALDDLETRLDGAEPPGNGRAVARLREPLAAARRLVAMARFEQNAPDLSAALARAEARYRGFMRGQPDA